MEIKVSKTYRGLEEKCDEALRQIEEQRYDEALREEGYEDIWGRVLSKRVYGEERICADQKVKRGLSKESVLIT